jgi:mRNA-degrading endonuclease toxin of MazEF toxin-antitoxin module
LKAWKIWTWEGHPCILLSNQERIDRKQNVVVLKGQTLYSGDPGPNPLEIVLNTEDGLDRRTVFVCDLLFTARKSDLSGRRGEVRYERRRAVSQRILQGLALAGL